jgi:hypothetical protein
MRGRKREREFENRDDIEKSARSVRKLIMQKKDDTDLRQKMDDMVID